MILVIGCFLNEAMLYILFLSYKYFIIILIFLLRNINPKVS
jgi:hypothetical protein